MSEPSSGLAARTAPHLKPGATRELILRTASALVMALIGLAAVWFGGVYLMFVTGLAAGLMAWELLRMAAPDPGHALLRAFASVSTAAVVILGGQSAANTAISFVVYPLLVGIFMIFWPRYRWVSGAGLMYIAVACGAFLLIRNLMVEGRSLVLAMLFCIWATDIAAYFGGRSVGGPRLAPLISPNKTWAGYIAGCLAGTLIGSIAALVLKGNPYVWTGLGLAFGALAQGGDLLESWAKRHFGVKDTSGIIPGHGGLLDRLDGHLTCTAAFALLLLAWPPLALVLT